MIETIAALRTLRSLLGYGSSSLVLGVGASIDFVSSAVIRSIVFACVDVLIGALRRAILRCYSHGWCTLQRPLLIGIVLKEALVFLDFDVELLKISEVVQVGYQA